MAISDTSREKLSWLLLESVLIVVSILLAFWIEAWWSQRNDRIEEIEILIGLEAEFVDVRERLERWANINERGMAFIGQFLAGRIPTRTGSPWNTHSAVRRWPISSIAAVPSTRWSCLAGWNESVTGHCERN